MSFHDDNVMVSFHDDNVMVSFHDGNVMVSFHDDNVMVSFHDDNGDEEENGGEANVGRTLHCCSAIHGRLCC